jgi:hypothetical protein
MEDIDTILRVRSYSRDLTQAPALWQLSPFRHYLISKVNGAFLYFPGTYMQKVFHRNISLYDMY